MDNERLVWKNILERKLIIQSVKVFNNIFRGKVKALLQRQMICLDKLRKKLIQLTKKVYL